MAKFIKWLGGGLGWAVGGPVGGVLGFILGSLFDGNEENIPHAGQQQTHHRETTTGDFVVSLLVLCAAVMRADGRVMRSELDLVKAMLRRNYGEEATRQYLQILKELLNRDVDVAAVCRQMRSNMTYSMRTELMHLLFRISHADGSISSKELETLQFIGVQLGITQVDYQSVRAMFVHSPNSDYQILEIEPNVSDDEVKKAYRRMAMKFHPDKLSSLGEQMKKEAGEKFRRVQEAYENIKKQRGMN